MKGPSLTRGQLVVPVFLTVGLAASASAVAFYSGQALAYVSLVFGVLFFAFAVRYYVATISVLLAPSVNLVNGKNGSNGNGNGGNGNGTPMVSVHIALYNEERVVDRLLTACNGIDYPNYEVIVVDDSTDGTVVRLKEWILRGLKSEGPRLKIIHRTNRKGFKGGALNEALKQTSPKAEYVVVFDADFVPEPDIIKKFLAYFAKHSNGNGEAGRYANGKLAAVQGYQWHTLNRTENWLTRGVSCEFSGNYMVDRTFQEVTGVMKMVAGSVYMVRADVLKEFGWTESITEDWELTLRLYERGYKVLYTPLVQAPAECPSTLGKLIRQRMRWAEGHTYNVKKHFIPVLASPKLGIREKVEFLYFSPYYLQSVFLILGTFSWLTSDILLGAKLPFFTAEFGWGLVITNLLALPLMSLTGLFLEKRARKDFRGLLSQLVLIYALSPYQAYAALKGLIEPIEGSWVRTFKSGKVAGFPGKLEPRKVIKNVLPPKRRPALPVSKAAMAVFLGVSLVFAAAYVQGQAAGTSGTPPTYYFYDQPAPSGYLPYPSTPSGVSFLMHLTPPPGPDVSAPVGSAASSGLIFFSDPAPDNTLLPYGASVSAHLWIDASGTSSGGWNATQGSSSPQWLTTTTCGGSSDHSQTCTETQTTTTTTTSEVPGVLDVTVAIYNPATNTITDIQGAAQTELIPLSQGVNYYEATWGNFAQNQMILKGETLVATIWCQDCTNHPLLIFNGPAHPSGIDFPIEVPEDSLGLAGLAIVVPLMAGTVVSLRSKDEGPEDGEQRGLRKVQTYLIVAAALIFMSLPLVLSFNDLLASAASATGLDRIASAMAPYEASAVADLLRGFGLAAGSGGSAVWLGGGFIPVTATVDWNCVGWQSFFLFGLTSVVGAGEVRSNKTRLLVLLAGGCGIFALNILRVMGVVLLGYDVGYPTALIFHDYGGAVITLAFLLVFWTIVIRRYGR